MIIQLAWKNIWRARKRSLIVIGSIAIGVWALIFLFSFLNSFNEAYAKNAIQYEYSHIQIHNPAFLVEPDLENGIDQEKEILGFANALKEVSITRRLIVNGMIASSKSSQGLQILELILTKRMELRSLKDF